MTKISDREQIQELDWIRGISALLIVLYHFTTQYEISIGHITPWRITIPWGCGAVNVFFMLTGFLTVYSIKMGMSPLLFAWKRIKRLYPAYWICIVITSVVVSLFLKDYMRSMSVILVNFTMLQNFFGIPNVDGVYWTLSYELIFYFYIVILLLFKSASLRWIRNLSLAWIVLSYIYYAFEAVGFSNMLTNSIRLAFMPYFTASFAGGIILGTVAKEQKRGFISYIGVFASIVLSFMVQERSYSVLYCIAVIVLALIVEERFIIKDTRYVEVITIVNKYLKPLTFVAGVSYPLYLLHQFIGFAIIKHLEASGLKSEIIIIAPLAIVLFLAYLVQKSSDRLMSIGKREDDNRAR